MCVCQDDSSNLKKSFLMLGLLIFSESKSGQPVRGAAEMQPMALLQRPIERLETLLTAISNGNTGQV